MTIFKSGFLFPHFWQSIRNSYTQIFFAKNPVLGVVLILVSFFDPGAGLSGFIAVISSQLMAYFNGLNRKQIVDGLYGFNALLTGLGLGLHFQFNIVFLIVLISAALLSLFITVALEGVMAKYGLPYLSIPFLLSMWIALLSTRQFLNIQLSQRGIFILNEMYLIGDLRLVKIYLWFEEILLPEEVKCYFRSLGAILFQHHLFAGILIALGLIIWSRIAFFFSVAGFSAACLFYLVIGSDIHTLSYSYIGFNFILTSIAIGVFFVIPSLASLLWVVLTVPLIAFLISAGNLLLEPYQLSIYTLPFSIVVILLLYYFKVRECFQSSPALVSIQQGSPERNLYSFLINRKRFWYLGRMPMSLPFFGKWTVTQGVNGEITHKDVWKHAWDFEIYDDKGLNFRTDGSKVEDYYCFGKPVLATADGYVAEIIDGIADNLIGDSNTHDNWGNSIVIRHADGLYSQLSHLQKGSIRVQRGQYVRKGEPLASCGNSGRSPFPHLHFQFQSAGQVGAATIDYLFAAFLKQGSDQSFCTSAQPLLHDVIWNHQPDPRTNNALHFIPGQTLQFEHTEDGEIEKLVWVVETDIYNNSFLHCQNSGSKAWFIREPDIFYFTHFEGRKDSLLFDFYLGAYQIVTGDNPGLQIQEDITTAIFPNRLILFFHDFIAPFLPFLRIRFRIRQLDTQGPLDSSPIQMASEVEFLVARKSIRVKNYLLVFDNNQLVEFSIIAGKNTKILRRV
ncbi:MAG: urea transporter [Bacteroidales bacterium]|jgi:urea transporter|nr:urea transporter [Bacteroidales bacterium]MDD3700576.1 urea transporter [Bacteroidales bacterium]MDY0368300.1 urea transporter [Bacteroidales bacterium]